MAGLARAIDGALMGAQELLGKYKYF